MAKKKSRTTKVDAPKRHGPVPLEVRKRIVQAVMRGTTHADTAVVFGVSTAVVQKFMGLFRSGGLEALHPRHQVAAAADDAAGDVGDKPRRRRRQSAEGSPEREGVIALREANPDWGARRLSDVLSRFQGLGISDSTVLRILHEEGLVAETEPFIARDKPERRFERAEPNQLWQSDIFTFELRRHQRLYVAAFLDDHSRYLVSWAVAHHQKSSLVLEAIERGIAEYGEPREVLTDQGRQYTAWRGTTDFEHLLRRHGIAHVKSRPQHPQTLGKIERFWKSLWTEFLSKTVFADFADCQRRLGLYVQHYNFQRPHQGIDGLVPADRFFRAAAHVRAAVEAQVTENALRLAREKPAQKPFYLVGRLGDQDLSIAASGGALRVQVGDAAQTIPLRQEQDHEPQASRTFIATDETEERPSSTSPTAGATLADGSRGSRSGGAATMLAGAVGTLGREAGHASDLRARDVAAALLSARVEGTDRDADGAGTGSERDELAKRRDAGASGGAAGESDLGARAGQATPRAPAVPDEEGAAARAGDGSRETGPTTPRLVGRWARTIAWLERDDDDDVDVDSRGDFDPELGWRDEAVSWRRKLAGAEAPAEGDLGGDHDPTTRRKRTVDVSRAPEYPRSAEASIRASEDSPRRSNHDQRSSARAGNRASEHAEPATSGRGRDPRRDQSAPFGTDAEIGLGEGVDGTCEGAGAPELEATRAAPGGRRHDGSRGRDHQEPARTAPTDVEEFRFPLDESDNAFASFWTEVAEGIAKLDAEKLAAEIVEHEQSRSSSGTGVRFGSPWRNASNEHVDNDEDSGSSGKHDNDEDDSE